jgi:hypothetical protein
VYFAHARRQKSHHNAQSNSLELSVKHKRRNPLVGPLVTVILMISSIVAIGAIAHLIDLRTRAVAPTVVAAEAAVREGASQ